MSSRLRSFVVTNTHNTGAPLDHSAAIELADTDRGFLPNRLTTVQRDAIANPAPGLLIYNTTASTYQFFDGATWQGIGGGSNTGLVLLPGYPHTYTGEVIIDIDVSDVTYGSYLVYVDDWLPSVNDFFAAAFGYDNGSGGTIFLNDTTHFDSYSVLAIAQRYNAPLTPDYFGGGDSLLFDFQRQTATPTSTPLCTSFRVVPGSAASLSRIVEVRSFGEESPSGGFTDPTFAGAMAEAWVNPDATITPTPTRAKVLRILPDGNGDADPPTSGHTQSCRITVYGVPAT